jgi:hypothetical protein
MPFGAPDSRSAAMGKTGVAMADSTNAAYFNPALLAMFSERKHLGGNQRIAVPSLSAFASDNARELIDIDDADYDAQLDNGVADFNTSANTTQLINSLESLSGDLDDTASNPLFADVFANIIVKIPDQHEGGAVHFSRRAVLDGNLNYTEADKDIISDYLEELTFVSEGGEPATLHPELYMDGQLINPNDTLYSSIDAVALIFDELAVSMGWAVTWWNTDMMIGFTPKAVRVTTYEYSANATSGRLTKRGEHVNDVKVNLDLGWAKKLNDNLTIGAAVHNLIPHDYRTESDRLIKLEPQARIAGAYQTKWGKYAIDLDLLKNDPLSKGDPTQELGIGGEWEAGSFQFRAGMVKNFQASGENSSPLYTFGVHFEAWHFYSDLSYGNGNNQKSAALQFGLKF